MLLVPGFGALEFIAAADCARAAKLSEDTRPPLPRAVALCIRLAALGVIPDFPVDLDLDICVCS